MENPILIADSGLRSRGSASASGWVGDMMPVFRESEYPWKLSGLLVVEPMTNDTGPRGRQLIQTKRTFELGPWTLGDREGVRARSNLTCRILSQHEETDQHVSWTIVPVAVQE